MFQLRVRFYCMSQKISKCTQRRILEQFESQRLTKKSQSVVFAVDTLIRLPAASWAQYAEEKQMSTNHTSKEETANANNHAVLVKPVPAFRIS